MLQKKDRSKKSERKQPENFWLVRGMTEGFWSPSDQAWYEESSGKSQYQKQPYSIYKSIEIQKLPSHLHNKTWNNLASILQKRVNR
jgi:hypothetical protein